MLVFYSDKSEASIRVIEELKKKGKRVEPVCIDQPGNRNYLKKYSVSKIPTIIDIESKTKIEGKSCFVYINTLQSVITGYTESDVSERFSGPNGPTEQYNIFTPADGTIDRVQQNSFIIPNEGLLGNKITSTSEESVETNNDSYQKKMQELVSQREN